MNISEDDILRSVDLLDQSVNPSNRSLLLIRESTPRKLLAKHKQAFADSRLNLSGRSFYDPTLDPEELSLFGLNKTTFPDASVRELDVADSLFANFLECMQSHASDRRLFDTVADFIQNCQDTIDLLNEHESKRSKITFKNNSTWIEDERNTWRLVYCLYQNRLSTQQHSESDSLQVGSARKLSEKEIVEELFKNDSVIRECQLVIDWLEQNAADQYKEEPGLLKFFTDKTVSWENTLHCLQNKNKGIAYSGPENLVTQLDPDAPFRQRKLLHPLDEEDDKLLSLTMFHEIRCGRLDEAQVLCKHCGCYWKAALLEGWRLYHDPNYNADPGPDGEKLPAEGNRNRDLWKVMAWNTIEKGQIDPYMQACIGAFCGHLNGLMPVCKTWPDILWAYFRVVVDIRVEKELRASSTRCYIPMPEDYWNNLKSIEDVFVALPNLNENNINRDQLEERPMYFIQKMIILNQVAPLMESVENWLDKCGPQFLRFLAHLVLFFRLSGLSRREDIGDLILQAYIKVLMDKRNPHLVAYYVSLLPAEDQMILYSQFLQTITQHEERLVSLAEGEEAGLDIHTITRITVENIRKKMDSEEYPELQPEETPLDLEKVSAVDWLVVYPEQRFDLLWQANAIMRQFLGGGKLELARKTFNKIPVDSIDLIMKQYCTSSPESQFGLADVNSILPPKVAASCREYLCISAYLDAQEAFSNWFEHFHNAKPKAPAQPQENANFSERVAYEQRENMFKTEMDRWRTTMLHQTKAMKDKLHNVLAFPDGGWMVDAVPYTEWELDDLETEELNLRKQQMESLRQLCIPKIVLLLHSMLYKMGEYQECVQLADIIVDERHGLYKVYMVQGLRDILSKICDSSVQLLHQKKDPWGFPVTS